MYMYIPPMTKTSLPDFGDEFISGPIICNDVFNSFKNLSEVSMVQFCRVFKTRSFEPRNKGTSSLKKRHLAIGGAMSVLRIFIYHV